MVSGCHLPTPHGLWTELPLGREPQVRRRSGQALILRIGVLATLKEACFLDE